MYRREDPQRDPAGPDSAVLRHPADPDRDTPDAMAATRELSENPTLRSKILHGMKEPLEECVPEDEVSW